MQRQFILAAMALGIATAALASDKVVPRAGLLFWTPAQQVVGYRTIEKIFPTRTVKAGTAAFPLPASPASFDVRYDFQGKTWTTETFMKANHLSGLLVIKDGTIRLERYGLGRTQKDRWTSFSVGKSVTSTLIGAAIEDGYIKSLDSAVTDYVPALKGSAYEGVTIRNLLTMTSGVKWNEDYNDPNSDVAKFASGPPGPHGESSIVAYMARLPREAEPGTKLVYKTGESDLIGVLLSNATHKHPADYLSEKIWSTFGMEQDAVWMLDSSGLELGGCCISMTLRDYGRFGMFMMGGGMADGRHVLPPTYVVDATKKQIQSDVGPLGYGFQWWIYAHGPYEAIGIFGQSIYIDPAEHLVIVTNSAWPEADADKYYIVHAAYVDAVTKALHRTQP
jgi:CubicO group peptidase (beta-lactamase class C family)